MRLVKSSARLRPGPISVPIAAQLRRRATILGLLGPVATPAVEFQRGTGARNLKVVPRAAGDASARSCTVLCPGVFVGRAGATLQAYTGPSKVGGDLTVILDRSLDFPFLALFGRLLAKGWGGGDH